MNKIHITADDIQEYIEKRDYHKNTDIEAEAHLTKENKGDWDD